MQHLDLESLACVDALAQTLSFRAAAKSCALSPAAFGKRVQQVEEQLATTLFHRTTRKVQLTPEGTALLPRVRRLLAEARSLTSEARGEEPPVDVVLGTRHELGMSWLLPARRRLAARLPHVTVHLRFGHTDELEAALLSLRADAVIISRVPKTRRLDALPLHREDYVLVASPRLIAERPLKRPEHAREHVLVDADDALPLFSYLRGPGRSLRFSSHLTLGTIAAIRQEVLDGGGVAVLPRYFVRTDLERRRLVRVLPRLCIAHDFFRLLFRADDPKRGLLERIGEILAEVPLK